MAQMNWLHLYLKRKRATISKIAKCKVQGQRLKKIKSLIVINNNNDEKRCDLAMTKLKVYAYFY